MKGQQKSFIPDDSETIIQMEIERLKTFKDHPFKVQDDSDMKLLKESIEEYGILNPLIVRPLKEGVYEIVSGHRRRFAAEKLGYRKVPVIIRVMRDEESIIAMVAADPRKLQIEGILLTMVDFRTNYAKDITEKVRNAYGSTIKIFDNAIPLSVKAAEASAEGISIFKHCQKGKVAQAYQGLTMEVLENEK